MAYCYYILILFSYQLLVVGSEDAPTGKAFLRFVYIPMCVREVVGKTIEPDRCTEGDRIVAAGAVANASHLGCCRLRLCLLGSLCGNSTSAVQFQFSLS